MGFNLSLLFNKQALLSEAMQDIIRYYLEGKVKPIIGQIYPFEEIDTAHAALQAGQTIGKVVVTLD